MAGGAIEIRGLRVRRGGNVVLDGLSLDVAAGSVTGLLGPSGSGKSTLIRAIVGVQIVEAGEVVVLGEPAGSPQLRSRVGYVTQAPSVYGDLTVRENLGYFARILQVPRARVEETIDEVDLRPQADRLVNRLSGGQRARVSLATALLNRPELLVLDEPTVGLDPVLRRDLWRLFHSLAEAGSTLLVSSHVMDEATAATALLLLRDGGLLGSPTPDELRRRTGDAGSGGGVPGARRGGRRMSPRVAGATAVRVMRQLGHDLRTVALVLVVPVVLVVLIKYVFRGSPVFDRIGGPLLGVFPLISMFLVTSITMLRERTTGTLERLMTMPLAKLDLLAGYAAAFALVAAVQAVLVSIVAFWLLDLQVAGAKWAVILLAIGNAVLGTSLGLFVSAFARTEFQAVQFLPAFVFPQLLICGLLAPRSHMSRFLEIVSWGAPLTYAYDALDRTTRGVYGGRLAVDVAVVLGLTAVALLAGALTLRRRTP